MFKLLVVFALLVSCGKVSEGSDGRNGLDGLHGENGLVGPAGLDGRDYYSYMVNVSLQEIIGDGRSEEIILNESSIYQLPKSFEVTVDNSYPECQLKDFTLIVETDTEIERFIFQATDNRYKMKLKSGPVQKVLYTSQIRVYYESEPEVDCGSVVYRLHSGVTFNLRIIKELEIE